MVRLDLLSSLLVATGVVQAVANTPQIVPGAYIVEYETNQVSRLAIEYRQKLKKEKEKKRL